MVKGTQNGSVWYGFWRAEHDANVTVPYIAPSINLDIVARKNYVLLTTTIGKGVKKVSVSECQRSKVK